MELVPPSSRLLSKRLQVMYEELEDFKKIDGLISVNVFPAGPTTGVVFAAYTTTATLDAATPIIGPLLAGMGPNFASPPTPFGTVVEFSTFA